MEETPRKEQVLAALRAHLSELNDEFGVKTLAVFGSIARDEARSDSDVDILVEFSRPIGLFGFVELEERLAAIIGRRVDLGTSDAIKPRIRTQILSEAAV